MVASGGWRESGVSKEDLEGAINLVAAINAGIVQAIAGRRYEHIQGSCPVCGIEDPKG